MGKLPDMSRVDREVKTQKKETRNDSSAGGGFLFRKPKPDGTDSRVREVEAVSRGGPIIRAIREIVTRSEPDEGPSTGPPATIVIPMRPERCPQDSLDHLCRRPGAAAGSSN